MSTSNDETNAADPTPNRTCPLCGAPLAHSGAPGAGMEPLTLLTRDSDGTGLLMLPVRLPAEGLPEIPPEGLRVILGASLG